MKKYLLILFVTITCAVSCKKFVEVKLPSSQISTNEIFNSDFTATAALTGLYSKMFNSVYSNGPGGLLELTGLAADELTSVIQYAEMLEFERNRIQSDNGWIRYLWNDSYTIIYQANAVLEGLASSTGVSPSTKKQLSAEARFVRAFCHFYLVNSFGDIPLITTTDYTTNSKVTRTPAATVYQQITDDLLAAKNDLAKDYITQGRVRPNKYAASALLARVYAYQKKWVDAEKEATFVIDSSQLYTLMALRDVFLTTSNEAIWQLVPNTDAAGQGYTGEAILFAPDNLYNGDQLTTTFYNSFETGDNRKEMWTADNGTYRYPIKYRQYTYAPLTEYSMVIRLAEMYLIRAEARIRQDKVAQGVADLNTIRDRARAAATVTVPNPLPPLQQTISKEDAIIAMEKERRAELFTEWGHRWYDLNRWERATAVLSPLKPGWSADDHLFPLPEQELARNKNLRPQNPGY